MYGCLQVIEQLLDYLSYLCVELGYRPAGKATVGFTREKLLKIKHEFLLTFRALWPQFYIELPVLKGANHRNLLVCRVARSRA